MPLGILEDNKVEHVPGTAPLRDLGLEGLHVDADVIGNLKHDGNIVLVPQPSDSPNDPYNWPRRKKELFTVAIAWGCGCVGAVGPLLVSAFVPLAKQYDVSLSTFVSGCNGSLIAAIAVGSLLFNSLAVKIGKRPIYLGTTIGLMATCFWAVEAKGFGSLVAARTIQGLCMAPMEALVPASIADIWFVHERGYRTAIFNLGVLGGINLASPIAGQIIQYGSARICLHAMGAAFFIQLLLTFFWMPESAFKRVGSVNIDTGDKSLVVISTEHTAATLQEKGVHRHEEEIGSGSAQSENVYSWSKQLRPYSGYVDDVSYWKTLIRPFYMLASPMTLWATILFTTCISWLVLISITLSQIFSSPPYNFSVSAVGASNLSSFVASLLGTIVAKPAIDGLIKYMSKRNNGTFEPEFRLPIMVTYLAFTATGFFAWGQTLHEGAPWPLPVILCLGFINFGVQLGTTGVVTYVVDCHRQQAAEAFAAMNFVKNLFAFGMTFYVNDWIASLGVRDCFYTIGGITIGVTLLTIPMYIFGKRARSFTYRHKLVDRHLN